jgi:hypothetical protein
MAIIFGYDLLLTQLEARSSLANAVAYVDRVVDGEERWHTLAMVGGDVILLVAYH